MFIDIKSRLNDPIVHRILAPCLFDDSPQGIAQKVKRYKENERLHFYGWIEQEEIYGVCGFSVHTDAVEILHIAVAETRRRMGVGGLMLFALQKKFRLPIKAETDDDAVGFYIKTGFETTAIRKYDVRRWLCELKYYKPVDQITDEERAALFPIVLQEHNPAWKDWYAKEKNILTRLVGVGNIARISHYGSTAVPGLLAKPTIDILLEITDGANVDTLISNLENAGYVCIKQPKVPCSPSPSLMFLKGYTPLGFAEKVYHIHVRYYGDWDELYFRDYLITHSDIAAEYAALKQKLQKEYEYDRDGYTEAKGEFIKATTEKAKKETEIA